MLGLLDDFFEILSVLCCLGRLVLVNIDPTLLIPPCFGTFSDVDIFGEFIPDGI